MRLMLFSMVENRQRDEWARRRPLCLMICALVPSAAKSWLLPSNSANHRHLSLSVTAPAPLESQVSSSSAEEKGEDDDASSSADPEHQQHELFDDFVDFLLAKQSEIVQTLEDLEAEQLKKEEEGESSNSAAVFSRDTWGMFVDDDVSEDDSDSAASSNNKPPVGGITRVLQGGRIIEKGACSFTLIGQGVLTPERAATIRARQGNDAVAVTGGDEYAAAALSMVLHSHSPHVPTFRSDVRVFLVKPKPRSDDDDAPPPTMAWFGGGADLTPYYLNADDITSFHQQYADLCQEHWDNDDSAAEYSYQSMKRACDEYFYLPARQEHRGTGGIFFDDMILTPATLDFCKGVANTWMPSWIPIVQRRQGEAVTAPQRQWQLLRRGRYLEFNLLYDRGVRFGLANANPRVEGVMVSAPPLIAFEYNHAIEDGSPEAELLEVLKVPKDWV